MHILCWDEMWHKNTFSSFFLSLSKFDRIVIIIIFRGDLDMFLWDCLSYLQHKCSIMLIQLLSHTHVSVRQQLQSNDLSAANNYTFTEMILQSWYFIRERQLQMTSETRHKDMSMLKSPVCDIMSSSESKGHQLHPKDQNHISTKSPRAVFMILWELQGWKLLAWNTFEQLDIKRKALYYL